MDLREREALVECVHILYKTTVTAQLYAGLTNNFLPPVEETEAVKEQALRELSRDMRAWHKLFAQAATDLDRELSRAAVPAIQ